MPDISFVSEQIDFSLSKQLQVADWLSNVCVSEGKTLSSLCVIFCSDEYLLAINKKHLSHDYYTDVITFDYSENSIVSGDIFISIDRVNDNAQSLRVSTEIELYRIMVHGLLHLLRFKDKNPRDKKVMTQKEDFYLSLRSF